MQFDNTNRGAIWRNDKKESDKHPDFKGKLNVEGVDYWVSAWKRKPDQIETAPSLSFSITPVENKAQEIKQSLGHTPPSSPQPNDPDNWDDDIPF